MIEQHHLNSIVEQVVNEQLLVLKEVDIKKVHPNLKGLYAFVLAYNAAMSQGILARSEPISIEFDEKQKALNLAGNTIYVPPNLRVSSVTFTSGSGHDVMHILTQNIFKHFQRRKSQTNHDLSYTNTRRFNLNDYLKVKKWVKTKYNVDFEKLAPEPASKTENDWEVYRNKLINALRKEKAKLDMVGGNHEDFNKVEELIYSMSFTKKYFDQEMQYGPQGEPLPGQRKNTITHSVEEVIGNIVSDELAYNVSDSIEIGPDALNGILRRLDDTKSTRSFTEFPPYVDGREDVAQEQVEKWKNYFRVFLPKFIEIYNQKIGMLNRTKFGNEFLAFSSSRYRIEEFIDNLIDDELLFEIDVKQVNKNLKGLYAFVQAYNDAITTGVLNRSEPVSIEFDQTEKDINLANNTIYVNPKLMPYKDTFINGGGHDVMHLLSQNIFKHFQRKKGQSGQDTSPNNLETLNLNNFLKVKKWLNTKFGIDIEKLAGPAPSKTDKEWEWRHYLRKVQTKIEQHPKFGMLDDLNDITDVLGNLPLEKSYFKQNLRWKESKPAPFENENEITHAIEETISNVISDNLAESIASSEGIDIEDLLNSIDYTFESIVDTTDFSEFKPYVPEERAELAEDLILKWTRYFKKILPPFVALYNRRLERLRRTEFGKEYDP